MFLTFNDVWWLRRRSCSVLRGIKSLRRRIISQRSFRFIKIILPGNYSSTDSRVEHTEDTLIPEIYIVSKNLQSFRELSCLSCILYVPLSFSQILICHLSYIYRFVIRVDMVFVSFQIWNQETFCNWTKLYMWKNFM